MTPDDPLLANQMSSRNSISVPPTVPTTGSLLQGEDGGGPGALGGGLVPPGQEDSLHEDLPPIAPNRKGSLKDVWTGQALDRKVCRDRNVGENVQEEEFEEGRWGRWTNK